MDNEDHCCDILPLSNEISLTVQEQQEANEMKKKKKKCRGNRKLQHFRRKCRAKGMNNQAIEMLISIKQANTSVDQNTNNKEMEYSSIMKNVNNDDNQASDSEYVFIEENSFDTGAIQAPILLQSIEAEYQWIPSPSKTHKKKMKCCKLSTDQWKRSSKLVANYNKLPNYLFKRLLSKSIPCYYYKIQQWLKNVKLLHFLRQRAELMRVMFQLKIEKDYWTHVLNLGMPAMIWLSAIVKNVKQQNDINWDYPRTVHNVKHRQKIIDNKLLQAENALNAHLQQQLPNEFCIQKQNKMSIDQAMHITSKALAVLIENGLHQLHTNFEHKKILLKFDVNDVHLVKSFYDLNPSEEQIRSVQKIWRGKVKSCKRTISQIKSSSSVIQNNILTMTNHIDEYNNDRDHQQDQICCFLFLLTMTTHNTNSNYQHEEMEIERLSQNMNQLSTNMTNPDKESLLKEIKIDIDKIPNYLTKKNESFKQLLHQALSTTTPLDDTDNKEELRKISILIYKTMLIQSYQLLWAAYLKSGTGQLIIQSKKQLTYSTNVSIWPKEIITMLQPSKNMKKTNEKEICLKFVNDELNQLDRQLKQYQMELNVKTNNFQGYTLIIEQMIETYIEQNLHGVRVKIEHKIELIHYDYHIQALKLEYSGQNPSASQKQLMKELCQSRYEQETTEQEVHFLEQQIIYYNSPSQSFECSPISQDPLINSIQDANIRQELLQQFKTIAEQSRANIFSLYMKTAKEQQEEYKKKHETNLTKMWNAYRLPASNNEKISPKMLDLMHQCCMKISERIKCIYKLKVESIDSSSKAYNLK
ncbi:unnamed protein product [Adineta steineri]|uniref:Uncharacterized protein n=2 Tax=Adineta steineri TaxID=433720 RepID=A0A819WLS7_9BILA|nr:unnamed protein product [Adineta steineri]